MKIKLLPSLKEKKRYIAFKVTSERNIPKNSVIKAIQASCRVFLGELNYGKAGVSVVENLTDNKKGVVRVNNKFIDHVKTSMILIKKIDGERVTFRNVKSSGVLNKLKEV